VLSVESKPTFRRNIPSPSSGWKNIPSKSSACHLLSRWFLARLIFRLRCSSETSVDFQRTTRRYIPENSTLYFNKPYRIVLKRLGKSTRNSSFIVTNNLVYILTRKLPTKSLGCVPRTTCLSFKYRTSYPCISST
jgi:hypothetical protein